MDSGLTIRPIAGSAETAYVRLEPAAVRTAVATTLAPSQTVTAANDSARSAAHDPARNAAANNVQREFVLDPQSREVIYRVIDVRTGQVQRQVPDAALMRMRAYTRAMADGKSPLDAGADTDNTA